MFEFAGAYREIDYFVGDKINGTNYLDENGQIISNKYDPIYEGFENCLITNNATCLNTKFVDFYAMDTKLIPCIINQTAREAYNIFAEDTFKYGKETVKQINVEGKVNLTKFNDEHKRVLLALNKNL